MQLGANSVPKIFPKSTTIVPKLYQFFGSLLGRLFIDVVSNFDGFLGWKATNNLKKTSPATKQHSIAEIAETLPKKLLVCKGFRYVGNVLSTQLASKNRSSIDPKIDEKLNCLLDRFSIIFRWILGPTLHPKSIQDRFKID